MKNLIVWLNSIINKHKALKRWRRVVTVLAAIMTFVTTYALILPAITVEKNKVEDVGGMYLEQEADTNDMLEENALEPIGVSIAAEHENAVTFAYADDSMTATAVFGTNDEIPAGAELVVTPIDPESVEYTSLNSRAAELLDKEFIYDVTTCSFYDFALVLNNVDVTPKTGLVDIQIIFHDNTVEHLDDTFFAGRFARSADDSSDVKDELVSVNPDESSVIELADGIITVLSLKGNDLSETDSLVGILAGNVDEEIKAAAAETDAEIPDSEDAQEESAQADSAGTDGEEAAPKVGTLKASGSDYTVTLTYDATSEIPEGASLTVSEIAQNSKEYKKYLEETKKAMGLTEEETLPQYAARFFDIKIMVGGDEFVPESGVTVEIAYTEPLAANPETEVNAVHFHNDTTEPEVIVANVTEISSDGTSNVEFTAEAFSVYGVVYTVDFHYEVDGKEFEFSIPGGGYISLKELIGITGIVTDDPETERDEIQTFVDSVADVTFSDPELVNICKAEEDTTVGQIKEKLELECEYSAELIEEEIEQINASEVKATDWVLLSLKPFETEETLTVTMKNGEQFTVKVTDAYNREITLHFVDESGQPITVSTYNGQNITPGSTFTLTANWLNSVVGNSGGELDLTKFTPDNGYTLSNTHKSTWKDMDGTDFYNPNNMWDNTVNYPHTIIGNELKWLEDNTLQYKLYYVNEDKAGWYWFNAGTEPTRDKDHWFHYEYDNNSSNKYTDPSDRNKLDTVEDNAPYSYDYFLVYSPVQNGSSSGSGGSSQSSDLNVGEVDKSKTLTPNSDGTYTMELGVTTAAAGNVEKNGVNIIFVFDTSSSMTRSTVNPIVSQVGGKTYYEWPKVGANNSNSRAYQTRAALQSFLTDLYTDVTDKDDIQLALIDFNFMANDAQAFGTEGNWTSDKDSFMAKVNGFKYSSGTNWADGLKKAMTLNAPNDNPTYVMLLTDGAPSQYWHSDEGNMYISGGACSLGAMDEARAVVNGGRELYGIFSFGTAQDESNGYISNLVNYAYNSNVPSHSAYAQDHDALVNALNDLLQVVKKNVAHTGVNYHDGIALDTTSTALKTNVNGNLGSITYSKTGGTSPAYTVVANSDGTIQSFKVNGTDYTSESIISDYSYTKISGSGSEIGTTTDTTTVYQCTVGSGDNAGTYIMPIATLEKIDKLGDLNWDLSPLGMMENGATYTISFVVWPNQEAYDYVADLNNGKMNWNKDTQQPVYADPEDPTSLLYYTHGVEGYPYIVCDPGSNLESDEDDTFAALTNTVQEVTYYTATEQSLGDAPLVYEGPHTVIPETPEPMPLTSTKSKIEKQWNVDRDPDILAQYLYKEDGTEKPFVLAFDVYQGDITPTSNPYIENITLGWDAEKGEYVWAEGSPTVTGTYGGHSHEIGTQWDADFAIATGLMLSEGKMNERGLDKNLYNRVVYNNTPYYILEHGHDYTIVEKTPGTISYEFDFKPPTYHPMLVDGTLRNVDFEKNGTTLTVTGMSDAGVDLTSLKVENTLRGYIQVNKVVVDENNAQIEEDKTQFEYVVTLNSPLQNGPFVGLDIPWYSINGLYYNDGHENYYQIYVDKTTGGKKLKNENGDVFDVKGDFNENQVEAQTITYYKSNGEEDSVELFGNQMQVSNNAKTATATLAITQDETLEIANVPLETAYTIVEIAIAGYDLISVSGEVGSTNITGTVDRGIKGTIIENKNNRITFKNQFKPGALKLTKLVRIGDKNGEHQATTAEEKASVDGIYVFEIAKPTVIAEPASGDITPGEATDDPDPSNSTSDDSAPQESLASTVVKYVQIKVENGVAAKYRIANTLTGLDSATWQDGSWALVTGLPEGDYIVRETNDRNGLLLSTIARGDNNTYAVDLENGSVTLHVTANDTVAAQTNAQGTFTNTYYKNDGPDKITLDIEKIFEGLQKVGEIPENFRLVVSYSVPGSADRHYFVLRAEASGVIQNDTVQVHKATGTTIDLAQDPVIENEYVKIVESKDGYVLDWHITGIRNDAKDFTVREVNYDNVSGYIFISAMLNGGDITSTAGEDHAMTVTAPKADLSEVTNDRTITSDSHDNTKFRLEENDILLIKLTGHGQNPNCTLIVSEHALNMAARKAIEQDWPNAFHDVKYYFSIEEHPDGFIYYGKTVTFGRDEQGKRTVTCTQNVSALEKVFEVNYDNDTYPNNATLKNKYTPKTVTLDLLKLDINHMNETTSLPEAGFTLRKLDPDSAGAYLNGDEALIKQSEFIDEESVYRISSIPNGFYEIEETEIPKGYILTDDGKFYIKVVNGVITRIDKCTTDNLETNEINETHVKQWLNHTANDNIVYVSTTPAVQDDPSTTNLNEAKDAIFLFKIGNTPGAELPSTGGPGTTPLYLIGIMLTAFAGAGLVMRKRRRDAA